MKYALIIFVSVVSLAGAGCGTSLNQVIAKYKDQYSQKREQLKKIEAKLPAPGSVTEEKKASALNPEPQFEKKSGGVAGNASVMAAEQLSDPEDEKFQNTDQSKLDLVAGEEDDLLTCLKLTGPKPTTVAKYSLDSGDQYGFARKCENGLNTRYVIVYRAVQFFEGQADVEVFLTDLEKAEILSAFRVKEELESLTKINVRTTGLETSAPEAKSAAGKRDVIDSSRKSADRNYSDLVQKVGKKIESKFAELTGGELKF